MDCWRFAIIFIIIYFALKSYAIVCLVCISFVILLIRSLMLPIAISLITFIRFPYFSEYWEYRRIYSAYFNVWLIFTLFLVAILEKHGFSENLMVFTENE